MKNTKNLYSGFFVEKISSDGKKAGVTKNSHITYEFGNNCKLPEGISEGDMVWFKQVGIYNDDEVTSIIVEVYPVVKTNGVTHLKDDSFYRSQPSSTPLHITVRNDGVSAVQGGVRPKLNGYKTLPLEDQVMIGKARADFFEVPA